MKYTILITRKEVHSHYNYSAIYLSDQKKEIEGIDGESVDRKFKVYVNKNDKIKIELACKEDLKQGNVYDVIGFFKTLSSNPNNGALLVVTKIK